MTTAKTRQEAAVEALREAIVDGAYAPGQRLRQQELAGKYGCSVIPIREALHQLAAEGFVVLDPQRGARVAAFDGRMLEEIFEVRIALERIAVQRAADRMTPQVAERTRRILERMEGPNLSPSDWVRLDWEFHDSLCACAEQEYLRKTISTLRRQMEPYLRLDLAKVGTIEYGRREHRRIFQACVRTPRRPDATSWRTSSALSAVSSSISAVTQITHKSWRTGGAVVGAGGPLGGAGDGEAGVFLVPERKTIG